MKKLRHKTPSDIDLPEDKALFLLEYYRELDIHKAAAVCGMEPSDAFKMATDPLVMAKMKELAQESFEEANVTQDWLMQELYVFYLDCRQSGKHSTALQALKTLGSLGRVDAYAAEKVELKSDRDIIERLERAKKRRRREYNIIDIPPDEVSFL